MFVCVCVCVYMCKIGNQRKDLDFRWTELCIMKVTFFMWSVIPLSNLWVLVYLAQHRLVEGVFLLKEYKKNYFSSEYFFSFLFFWGGGVHPWHMEVPGTGIESRLQLQPTTAVAMPHPLTHCTRLGIKSTHLQRPEPLQLDS